MGGMVRRCVVVGVLAIAALSPASAAGKEVSSAPRVSLTLPGRTSEGSAIPFSWASRNLGENYRLVVQRPAGTSRTWRTVVKLDTRRGSAELPAQTLGKYRFRLAAFQGDRLLAQQIGRVAVFGPVPFSVLLRGGSLITGSLGSGVYATPSNSFPYIGSAISGDRNRPNTVFSVKDNRCLFVHVGFVLGKEPTELYKEAPYLYGVMTLVQQSRDPIASEVPLNGIGSLDAELVPGQTWSLLVAENNREGKFGLAPFYFNGYAVCRSTEPLI